MLSAKDFSGILTQGGTILGTSRQPFKLMRTPDANGLDKVEAMKHTYHKLLLDCLVILGGNGTQKTANLLREEGLNIIHLPKTIDNDIYGTDMTFGFYSAVNIASDAIDCIHTTASSHQRVFIVEVMGHKVGWLTLYAGIARPGYYRDCRYPVPRTPSHKPSYRPCTARNRPRRSNRTCREPYRPKA